MDARVKPMDVARRLYGLLPPQAQKTVRSARSLVDRRLPAGPPLKYPPDVADREALIDFLEEAHVFEDDLEATGYLADAIERFRITMALVPDCPPGARVLELGSNPYFLTRLLRRRGLDVVSANYFGSGYEGPTVQAISASGREPETFEFDHFNVEEELFPYADGSFDIVLFCEILEHLPSNPVHTLAEIHRVLRPGGTMLLTTPNATRLTNLVRVWAGENFYEELSGYGTYGRHNREYTVAELDSLLTGCGYVVERIFAADLHPHPERLPLGVDVALEHRGDNLFVLATPHGEPRWHYPRWLYSSRHALRRVVRPDFLAGHNDVLQGTGFWESEDVNGLDVCWTGAGPRSTVTVVAAGPTATLRVEGLAPPAAAGDVIKLHARAGSQVAEWTIRCDGGRFGVEGPMTVDGEATVVLATDRTWVPRDMGINEDARSLGVAVHRVSLGEP